MSMERQVQERIENVNSSQKKELENTVNKLQHQINILNRVLEERQASRQRIEPEPNDLPRNAETIKRRLPGHREVRREPISENSAQSDARFKDEDSRLYGLGSTWCVAPQFIWKHVGVTGEPEIVTRRKCITPTVLNLYT